MVTVLTRLLWRDLWRTRSQVAAAVLVVGCGVATLVAMRNTSLALSGAQQAYYASYRFADLFVHLKRAPLPTVARVRALPGVAHVDARVVSDVTLDVPGLMEPATGHVVSIPEMGWPTLNLLHLQSGRYVAPGRDDEVVIGASFAEANGRGADCHRRFGLPPTPEHAFVVPNQCATRFIPGSPERGAHHASSSMCTSF